MSKAESKKRILRRKINRRINMISNIVFVLLVMILVIGSIIHLFTKKNEYREMGIEQFKAANYEEALKLFDKSLDCNQWFSDATNVDICLYKAETYIKLEKYEEAGNTYKFILDKYKKKYYNEEEINFMISLTDALMRYEEGKYISAVLTFVDAVDRGYTGASIFAAICYNHMDQYDDMIKYYDIYKNSYGANSCLYYQYSSYYAKQNNFEEALKYANEGVNCSDSVYIDELKYLQVLCYTKLADYNTAYSYVKDYVAQYPNDSRGKELYDYLDTRINIKTKPVNNFFGISNEDVTEENINSNEEN